MISSLNPIKIPVVAAGFQSDLSLFLVMVKDHQNKNPHNMIIVHSFDSYAIKSFVWILDFFFTSPNSSWSSWWTLRILDANFMRILMRICCPIFGAAPSPGGGAPSGAPAWGCPCHGQGTELRSARTSSKAFCAASREAWQDSGEWIIYG